jgi:hypothetical protein
LFSYQLPCTGWARPYAGTAKNAGNFAILIFFNRQFPSTSRANTAATAATHTAILENYDFWLDRQALRIMAPPAAQRAAFQEYGGTYSRTILDRILLDVGNQPTFHYFLILINTPAALSVLQFIPLEEKGVLLTGFIESPSAIARSQ